MEPIITAELLISLIRDDLTNLRLVQGLNSLGLEAGEYHLHLSSTILQLMGFADDPESDALYHVYMLHCSRVYTLRIDEQPQALDFLAQEVYRVLCKLRAVEEGQKTGERPKT